jgi:signal transduction histidine kinase
MEDHTILVVDDEPASLRALRRTLAPRYRVVEAGDGATALAQLEAEPISLIVTDHRMPGLTGVEMLVRGRATHPDVVRILLTGYAELEALAEAINAGAVFYYLTKPWEPHDLMLAVRRGLESLEALRQRRALLLELEGACARAEREAEQRTRLLATAAHELGTPVHVLTNAVDLLSGLDEVRRSPWLGIAERNLAWLRRSLAQMQKGFRLQTGGVRLAPGLVELSADLESTVDAVERAAGARRLTFERRIGSLPAVRADRRWLGEVWIALLSNAVRFTADGGRVEIAAEAAADGVGVRVADTGIGMSPEQVAVAFSPFSAAGGDLLLHASGRFEFGARGLGLGLSIARAVVELHGGRIGLRSEIGRGTSVEVWLPESQP